MDNLLKTSQVDVAAYLLTKGAVLISVDEVAPRSFEFVFKDPELCNQLLDSFVLGSPEWTLFENRRKLINGMKTGRFK